MHNIFICYVFTKKLGPGPECPWPLSLCFHQLSDLFQVTQELPVILTDVFVPREIKVFLFNYLFGGGEPCFLAVFPKMPKEGHFTERPPPAWSVRGFYPLLLSARDLQGQHCSPSDPASCPFFSRKKMVPSTFLRARTPCLA